MEKQINLLITGDFCPNGRYNQMTMQPEKILGSFFENIQKADVVITNLECPITTYNIPIKKTGPALRSTSIACEFLNSAGIKYVCLANNHILDYGPQGLEDTLRSLEEHNLNYLGAGANYKEASKPLIIEQNSLKIGILNFAENEWSTTFDDSPGASPIHPVRNFKAIQSLRKLVDKVIIITHGGHETYKYPSPRMKELFRFYVDAGADAVVNHHTHCFSGYEVYKEAPIFYSLGNFIFDHISIRNGSWNEGIAVNLGITLDSIDFGITHFNQANENAVIEICSEKESEKRNEEIESINSIIQDDILLNIEFDAWIQSQKKMFKNFIEPSSFRLLNALQTRKVLPSLWSARKKMFLLNLIKCEAHQDILVSILKDEISNT